MEGFRLMDRYRDPLRYEGRILEAVVRVEDKTAPLLLHIWPRQCQTSNMWRWFFDHSILLADPACPLLPAVQLFEHGQCTFIATHSPPRCDRIASDRAVLNMRRRLERVRDGFQAIAWLHRQGVSLNVIGSFRDTFEVSYAQRIGSERAVHGIAGCWERFAFTEDLPEQPDVPFTGGTTYFRPAGLPWAPPTASHDPRVAGPRLVSEQFQSRPRSRCSSSSPRYHTVAS